jgi:hypothetical protein
MEDALMKALREATWKWSPLGGPEDARSFQGDADGWRFTLVDFDISHQGFPGQRGADGGATHDGLVIHLPREVAAEGIRLATAQLGINGVQL